MHYTYCLLSHDLYVFLHCRYYTHLHTRVYVCMYATCLHAPAQPYCRLKFSRIFRVHLCRRRSAIWRRCNTTPWCIAATTEAGVWGWDRCDPDPWRRDTTHRRTAASLTCRHPRLIPGAEQTQTRLFIKAPTKLANRPPPYLIDEVAMHVGFPLSFICKTLKPVLLEKGRCGFFPLLMMKSYGKIAYSFASVAYLR